MNPLVKALKIKAPIFLAPMAGSPASIALTAEISNLGGLGFYGAGYITPSKLRETIAAIKTKTDRPFGINLLLNPTTALSSGSLINPIIHALERFHLELDIPPPNLSAVPESVEDKLQIILDSKISVFSFAFGVLQKNHIVELQSNGTFVIGTATCPEEATLLEHQGVDAIVAQGSEAGGHRGGFLNEEKTLIGLMSLIPQVVDSVTVPVIAAGGIADRRGVAAALALGATAVSVGTAFLSSYESGASELYAKAITNAKSHDSVLTRVFSGRLARGIRNRFYDEMTRFETAVPAYPIMHALTTSLRQSANINNQVEFLSLWAGQSSRLCRRTGAAEIFHELSRGIS